MVLVRRLEVQGFKSFAERAVLEFGPGPTGIVGPNGAGKSNITDAIRWVLGEQNPRILRSSRMEDIIFNGSETRKPLGFAEVVLTLDNQDGRVPLDFTEVSLTRRLYRSGESEYLLNGTPVRLKDLTDLLAGSGIGREGYSLVGQGRIDEVLMSTPESRRGLFDEACGIGVHRGRKREALARLDDVAARLERVSDVTAELETQLAPLDQQAAVARTFVAYRDELERLELWLESQALAKLRSRAVAARDRLGETSQKVAALRESQARLGEQARTLRGAQTELGGLVERKQQEAALSEAALRQLVGKIGDLERTVTDRRREADLVRGEQGRLAERLARTKVRLAEIETEKVARAERSVGARADLGKAAQEETAAKAEFAGLKAAVEATKAELLEVASQASAGRYQVSTAEADLSHLGAERARLVREAGAGRDELDRLDAEVTALSGRLGEVNPKVGECAKTLEELDVREAFLGGKLSELARQAEEERARVFELDTRRAAFEAAIAAASAWSRSALAAVAAARAEAAADGSGSWAEGLVSVLGEEIDVPASERLALEAALGRFGSALVVRTESDLRRLLAHIKSEGLGPAVIIPLDLVEKHLAGRKRENPPTPSLADLVRCAEHLRPVVEHLLGETIVARDFQQAQAAVEAGTARRAVTRDGILVRPGGVVSVAGAGQSAGRVVGDAGVVAGAGLDDPGSSLQRMRQLREVRTAVEAGKRRLASLSAEREAAEKALAEARSGRAHLGSEHRTLALEAATLSARLEELRRRRAASAEKIEAADLTLPELGQRILSAEAALKGLKESLRESGAREERVRATLARQEAAAGAAEEALAATAGRVGESRILVATLEEQDKAGLAEIARHGDESARLTADEARLADRLAVLAREAEAAQDDVAPLKERLAAATAAGGQRPGEDLETWRKRRREVAVNLEAVETELAELGASVDDWTDRQRREEARLARLKAEDEMTTRRLRRDWGEDWETKAAHASADGTSTPGEEDAQTRVQELRQAIGGLGVVNIGAIEEHRRLSERAQFLKGQAKDLTEARESLLRLIAEMDATMAAKFEEGFFAVRRAFREKISELFGGGRGDLLLTNRDSLLESGIEILVEPPTKKLQSLTLLSAGERALSALALVLSFLEVRPSPFVILDEIDAPLDDANVARFCAAVATVIGHTTTQFIIVTHNKTTMEISEALYGVIMGEDGVSRLLSVKLEEREAFKRRLEQEAG